MGMATLSFLIRDLTFTSWCDAVKEWAVEWTRSKDVRCNLLLQPITFESTSEAN